MAIDFIFQFIFYLSGRYNNRLPHHKREKTREQRRSDNNSHVNKHLLIKPKSIIICDLIYRFPYKLNLENIEEIAGNDEQKTPKQQNSVFPEIGIEGFQRFHFGKKFMQKYGFENR